MKKEYVAPKAMLVEMGEAIMVDPIGMGSGGILTSNSMSFMDFGGSTGGSPIAFN